MKTLIPNTQTPYRLGDHLRISRRLYYHHGIYIGHNKIIHYAPPPGTTVSDGISWRELLGRNSKINIIHITSISDFEFHEHIRSSIVPYDGHRRYPPLKVVARAHSRLGENGYNLWGNNCEHFAKWCMTPQNKIRQTNLWDALREGALLGFSVGAATRHWAGIAAGAGVGAVGGAIKHWLLQHRLSTVYAEFAGYATALYYELAEDKGSYPLGKSLRHAQQCQPDSLPAIPADKPDKQILFYYQGGWFGASSKRDWIITERAIICPGQSLYLDFHSIADIKGRLSHLRITDVDGEVYRLALGYAHARSVARFLRAAVAGTALEHHQLRRNLLGMLKGWWGR